MWVPKYMWVQNMIRQYPRIKVYQELFSTMMMWIQPRIQLAVFWQDILREIPFHSWSTVFIFFYEHLLVASVREWKIQLGELTVQPREVVFICVCDGGVVVCLSSTTATWSIPNQKINISRAVNMNSGLSSLAEIIHQMLKCGNWLYQRQEILPF